jgi:uncharacterized OsmC-like protein
MDQEKLKTAFKGMAEAVAQNPQMAQASALATVELSGGVKCLAKVRDFQLTVDEPSEMGGTDQGMNPVELLLAALGACQEIGYAYFAAVMGIPLKKVKCSIEGNLDIRGLLAVDDTIAPGYSDISCETIIESDADEEALKRLVDMVERHCPVLDTVRRPIPVKGTVVVKSNGRNIPIVENA